MYVDKDIGIAKTEKYDGKSFQNTIVMTAVMTATNNKKFLEMSISYFLIHFPT